MVDTALRIDFRLVLSRNVSRLCAFEDVEVVVCGVAAGVSLGALLSVSWQLTSLLCS